MKTDKKKLTVSLGTVEFEKTLFKNKTTRERKYLLDCILGIKDHERLTEDAEAELLDEAVRTLYERAGKETSLMDEISRQTVKNKLHGLEFPIDQEMPVKRRS